MSAYRFSCWIFGELAVVAAEDRAGDQVELAKIFGIGRRSTLDGKRSRGLAAVCREFSLVCAGPNCLLVPSCWTVRRFCMQGFACVYFCFFLSFLRGGVC
ncbi:hypothetical protein KC19_VG045700 [Ceratodon purpureus]|uniref:Uncharacterized protein n=1 Tax=Ceratodon purpureus TaxID=3225 RepID=A0A8T0HM12_CERPU|nr:hypothetical protein KC19_VG045700 [Ceratodon purpureus]